MSSPSLSAASASLKGAAASAAKTGAAAAVASKAVRSTSTTTIVITTLTIFITVIAGVVAAMYYSGYADDLIIYYTKKFYEAKAKTEAMALANTGSEAAQGFLKDQLKKNPVLGQQELDQISGGLGQEAVQEGLGGVSKKLGGLGNF